MVLARGWPTSVCIFWKILPSHSKFSQINRRTPTSVVGSQTIGSSVTRFDGVINYPEVSWARGVPAECPNSRF